MKIKIKKKIIKKNCNKCPYASIDKEYISCGYMDVCIHKDIKFSCYKVNDYKVAAIENRIDN